MSDAVGGLLDAGAGEATHRAKAAAVRRAEADIFYPEDESKER